MSWCRGGDTNSMYPPAGTRGQPPPISSHCWLMQPDFTLVGSSCHPLFLWPSGIRGHQVFVGGEKAASRSKNPDLIRPDPGTPLHRWTEDKVQLCCWLLSLPAGGAAAAVMITCSCEVSRVKHSECCQSSVCWCNLSVLPANLLQTSRKPQPTQLLHFIAHLNKHLI